MPKKLIFSAGIVFLLLGTTASVYAQQHDHEQSQPAAHQAKPAQQAHQAPQAKPAARPQQSYGSAYHGNVRPNAPPTSAGVHPSGVPQHQGQVRSGFVQSRATSWNTEHRTWAQRGGYNGYRIPDARFHQYFGRDHFFRINGLPMVFVGGFPRFQYDGYWVTFMDPWPEGWNPLWYETDDVYLDYTNDGYYLYSRVHPGIGMAVTISF